MAAIPCYSGPNPIKDEDRPVIWAWAKANGIDAGIPFEQIHQAINDHFFGGVGRAEWINDVLSGRKTPFKRASDAMWRAQANRRNIQQQAKHLVKDQNASLLERAGKMVIAGPRYVTLTGGVHSVVFPFTHGGALMLNVPKWMAFGRLVMNTWRNIDSAHAAILKDTMARSPRYTQARRNGLDFSTHGNESGGGKINDRTWGALVETRFRLWDKAMDRHIKPGMSVETIDSIGKELAVWANHATGSGGWKTEKGREGGIFTQPVISQAFFGPKLAQSYIDRLIGDPLKTVSTWANWKNATPGERVVARQRLQGAMWWAGTYTGMLAANAGILWATGQKDQINWTDPSQSDWLAFKGLGFRWGLPGAMHAEINLLGQIMAAQQLSPEQLGRAGMPVPWTKEGKIGKVSAGQLSKLRAEYVGRQLLGYVGAKLTPAIKLEEELRTGHDFTGRPLPWVHEKQTPKEAEKHPPMGWAEYLLSKPIILSGATKYVFDEMRKSGASVTDSSNLIRAFIISALVGTTAIEPKEIKEPAPHRTRYGHAQVGR